MVLRDVPWNLYVALRDLERNWGIRMTYDQGVLELMSPARRHERPTRLLDRFVFVLADELNRPISSCGMTTLRREDLDKGCEPDSGYYVDHEEEMRSHDDLDLSEHPPPDLVIESDHTSSSLPRMPIYAAMRVPELWRYDGATLQFYVLDANGEYVPQERSAAFPEITPADLAKFLDRRFELDELQLVRSFREWVRQTIGPRRPDGGREAVEP
ncbi:MAG: Uma2 family endonuclease [Planctomycetaceae bacterium]